MIRFISEDSSQSTLVKFYNSAYGETALIGAESNTRLPARARREARSGAQVVAFLDMVPDNELLLSFYTELRELYTVEKLDVITLPVVSAEFLFIKSLAYDELKLDKDACFMLLSKDVHYKDSAFVKAHKPEHSKSFERFSKLVCKYALKRCCCIGRGSRLYFDCDCACEDCTIRDTLMQKAVRYVKQYGVGKPLNLPESTPITWENIFEIHKAYVAEYNRWVQEFNDKLGTKYMKIPEITIRR